MSTNISFLTNSHKIVASKKRAKREQIKEITFDETARRDFLTGFHKRKVQKKEHAKKKAQEREKQERLETRREQRQQLAEQAQKNALEVERAYGGVPEDDDEDQLPRSTDKGKEKAVELEDEYEDEEELATVTVVEDFDPETLIRPPTESNPKHRHDESIPAPTNSNVGKTPQKVPSRMKKSTKSKDIKYETKAARNSERTKQRKRKLEKADRAGGSSKSSRKAAHRRTRKH